MTNTSRTKKNHKAAAAAYQTALDAHYAATTKIGAENKWDDLDPDSAEWDRVNDLIEDDYDARNLFDLGNAKTRAEDALIDALGIAKSQDEEFQALALAVGFDWTITINEARRRLSTRAKLLDLAHRAI